MLSAIELDLLLQIMHPTESPEEIMAIAPTFCATTTNCFDRSFPTGHGPCVYDAHGTSYYDLCARVGSANIGHRNEFLERFTQEFIHQFGYKDGIPHQDAYNAQAVLLARDIVRCMPETSEGWKVFYSLDGTGAVEAAIKACELKQRPYYVAFNGAFHGRTLGALSFNNHQLHSKGYRLAIRKEDTFFLDFPAAHPYFLRTTGKRIDLSQMTVADYRKRYLRSIEKNRRDIAALIVEDGVQGEGGMNVARLEIMQFLREFCAENDIVFIVDAVQSGIGRTGTLFAFQQYGIVPDVITLAKSLADGLPQGAMVCRSSLDFPEKGKHSNTNGGNPFLSALSRANLALICDKKLGIMENVLSLSAEVLTPWMQWLPKRFKHVAGTRNLGFMGGIEFWDPETKKPDPEFRNRVEEQGLKEGVVLLGCGLCGIRIMPVLTIKQDELVDALNRVARAIETVEQ